MTVEETEKLFAAIIGVIVFWTPILVGITEAIKRIRPSLPTEAYPVLALPFAAAIGLIYIAPGDPKMGALYALTMWLCSMGLYSGGKAVIGKS